MTEILFESPDLRVRCSTPDRDVDRWVVTFDSLQDGLGLDHPGFAEGVLAREELPAIHFIASKPHWFQLPEIAEALRIVRAHCAAASHRLVTGSSMGGYAALRFAEQLDATTCLAFSPQYSVDPERVPFETRWREHRLRIDFQQSLKTALRGVHRTILCFDPRHEMDKRHADLVLSEIEAEVLPVPFAGHVVTGHLNDIGLLAPLFRDALEETLDVERTRREAVARRKTSPAWLANMANVQPAHRANSAIALARLAAEKTSDNPVIFDALAVALRKAGRIDEALAAHRAALEIDDASLYLFSYSHTLEEAGDLPGAIAVMEQVQQSDPHIALHAKRASDLRGRAGDWIGAKADAARAWDLSPQQFDYRLNWWMVSARARLERLKQALAKF